MGYADTNARHSKGEGWLSIAQVEATTENIAVGLRARYASSSKQELREGISHAGCVVNWDPGKRFTSILDINRSQKS
jgi:hypothetical protein